MHEERQLNENASGQYSDWIPSADDQLDVDIDLLFRQVHSRRNSALRVRRGLYVSAAAVLLVGAGLSPMVHRLFSDPDVSPAEPIANQRAKEPSETRDLDAEVPVLPDKTVDALAIVDAAELRRTRLTTLAELELEMAELLRERQQLEELQRQQQAEIVREELSRTELLSLNWRAD